MTTAVVHRRSALEAFQCPRRYKAIYVDGTSEESGPARRGSAFHAAAHRYITELRRTQQTEDFELAAACLKAALIDTITPTHLVPEVTDLFWRWAETFVLNLDALLVTEEKQTSDEGYSWTPDLVYAFDDLIEIKDWKTHWKPFTDEQARREFQARWYLWQARRLWPGFQRYRIVFVFVRWGVEVGAEFDQADIDQVEPQVEAIVGAIARAQETDDWPAVPGQSCSYCTLTCPIVDHPERVPVRLQTAEQAERAALFMLAASRWTAIVGEALQGYCTTHGPIVVNGMEFAHRPAPTTQFPIAPVMRVLDDQGITPDFTVSKSTLRRYLKTKRFAHLRDAIEALARVKPGSRFSARKAGSTVLVDDDEGEE